MFKSTRNFLEFSAVKSTRNFLELNLALAKHCTCASVLPLTRLIDAALGRVVGTVQPVSLETGLAMTETPFLDSGNVS